MKRWVKLVLAALLVGALIVATRTLPVEQWLRQFQDVVEGMGAAGWVLYALVYVLATVAFVPGLVLTIGAGALYGPWLGTAIVSVGSTVGAGCAFLIARYVARHRVQQWVADRPKFSAIDRAVTRKGGWIVFLLRLSPAFPFNLLNYGLGLTGVRFWSYVLASWVGMLPATFAYVFVGYAGRQSLRGGQQLLVYGIGAVATLAVVILVTRVATRAVRAAGVEVDAEQAEREPEPAG